jgi:nucleoside-diphosphate-sugar epimerase
MVEIEREQFIVGREDLILVTGASGFIGCRFVERLLERGFRNLRCFVRPGSEIDGLESLSRRYRDGARVQVFKGNLLSREDCTSATKGVALIYHLATSRDGKSFPDAFMNSVVTTRNLLEASLQHRCLRRFVNISSLVVYSNTQKPKGRLLDEDCPVETHPALRGDAYSYVKVKQDEIVAEYGKKFGIPFVIVRPGYVLGPGKAGIVSRVGIGTFGVFLHLGGSNTIPFTYLDNCADAIALAGLTKGVDGEVFNVVDDDLPSSRRFLRLYKKNVRTFKSFYVPHIVSYALCYLWEKYSDWSQGQLPPAFSRRQWHANWKKTRYTNAKLKEQVGWTPAVPMAEAFQRYFETCLEGAGDA